MGFFDDICDWFKDQFNVRPDVGDGGLSQAVKQTISKPEHQTATPPHPVIIPTKVASIVVPAPRSRAEYEAKYFAATVKPEHVGELKSICGKMLANKDQYMKVEQAAKVPWFVVAAIHHMESDCDFDTHLHNGDPLTARTVHVPAGRPKHGTPPFSWYESAIDALGGEDSFKGNEWSLGATLDFLESYNGRGYSRRGMPSPYLWSGTDQYTRGLYVSDGEFDSNAVSKQLGAVCILKTLKAFV